MTHPRITEHELLASIRRDNPIAARVAADLLRFAEDQEGLHKWRRRSSISVRARLRERDNHATLFVIQKDGGFYTYWLHWPRLFRGVRNQFTEGLAALAGRNVLEHRAVPVASLQPHVPRLRALLRRTLKGFRRRLVIANHVSRTTKLGPWTRPDRESERAAVRHVTQQFRSDGYQIVSREKDNCGYDLEATHGRQMLHLEVMGCKGEEPYFFFSRGELACARRDATWRFILVTSAIRHPRIGLPLKYAEVRSAFALSPTQWSVLPVDQ